MTTGSPKARDLNTNQTRENRIRVIARAAQILRVLEYAPQGLTRSDLAERVGVSVSTVKRIVDSLLTELLLIAATPTSGVRLGPALIPLGQATAVRHGDAIQPTLAALARELGESVILATANDSNASGKVLLSTLRESSLERYLAKPLQRLTQYTITDPGRLRKELQVIRSKGISVDAEECVEGIGSLAIAFKNELGQVTALSVPLPVPRFDQLRKSVARRLVEVRAQIND